MNYELYHCADNMTVKSTLAAHLFHKLVVIVKTETNCVRIKREKDYIPKVTLNDGTTYSVAYAYARGHNILLIG